MSDHYSDSPMKPRNKQERQVAALSASLPDVTPKQRQWAINACFDKIGYVTKKDLWCSQCGTVHDMTSGEFSNATDNGELVCPHCGTKLKLKNSNKSVKSKADVNHHFSDVSHIGKCGNECADKGDDYAKA